MFERCPYPIGTVLKLSELLTTAGAVWSKSLSNPKKLHELTRDDRPQVKTVFTVLSHKAS